MKAAPQQIRSIGTDNGTLLLRYVEAVNQIVDLVQSAGYELTGFCKERPSIFPALPAIKQEGIVNGLEAFHGMCVSAMQGGAELKGDSHSAAWWVIRRIGWRPQSDVFSHVRPGDTIEIYDVDHVQIFRSFNMFRCISYSLDQLVTHEWYQLYSRPDGKQEEIMERFQRAISEKRTIVVSEGESHVVSERFSPRLKSAKYSTRLVSPLFAENNVVAGYINVIQAIPIHN